MALLTLPPGPWSAVGNRVYAADGKEILVATKADPRWRQIADETAIAAASLPAVVTAIRAIKTEALDQVSGATEDTGSDTRLSYIIDLCDKALIAAGASTL